MALVVRRPEEVLIPLSDGDWILIKKRLNAGESRNVFARMVKSITPGTTLGSDDKPKAVVDYEVRQMGLSKAVEYLIDWSAKDADGKPIVIRDHGAQVIEDALNALDLDGFNEITKAIDAHEDATDAALAQEKKDRTTPPVSVTT